MSDLADQGPDTIEPRKADAVHRALLTGLLSNVGVRNLETHEYVGARGAKFSIFPGSTLFKKRPAWVMSGELVETTKVYARTNAAVRPEWVERAAEHLVHRTYFEPHWQRKTAHVAAYEKVTLFGLVLAAKRLVHYGPIDPVLSRRIFIENALVDGDFRTDAEWFKHNRDLIRHVEMLEAKGRRRDLLADVGAQFAFYNARVPADVFNGPLFDKWRKHVERGRPTILFLQLRDLLKTNADDITTEKYPDEMKVGDMTLPLVYRFEPGHQADGVTVRVPLAGLNQIRAELFEWIVPGWREEKILALIRSLPKRLRTSFIPATEFAKRAAEAVGALGEESGSAEYLRHRREMEGSMLQALGIFLGKIGGEVIRAGDFDLAVVPEHLLMRFEVIDEAGKMIAAGRDLMEIRREVGAAAQENLSKLLKHPLVRGEVTSWDFGDLPEFVEIQRYGMTLHAYPALVDEGKTIGLRLFESAEAAASAHRAGVRRLFLMQMGSDAKNLARHVRNLEEASVLYTTIGPAEELRDNVLTAAADRALYPNGTNVRTRDAFVEHAQSGWRKLLVAANEITGVILETLREAGEVAKLMEMPFAPAWRDARVDVRRQLGELLPRGFVMKTPPAWLPHLPRFVRAVRVRLEKLRDSGFNRDLAGLVQIGPMFQQYLERRAEHERNGIVDGELEKYRWMLEELRVSLFAQELKTSMIVSVQRLDRQWMLVRQ